MLDNAEIVEKVAESKGDKIRVGLGEHHSNIDLAGILSCVTSRRIRRIYPDPEDSTKPGEVEFEDDSRVNLKNPPWSWESP